jgi:hypothetical protein
MRVEIHPESIRFTSHCVGLTVSGYSRGCRPGLFLGLTNDRWQIFFPPFHFPGEKSVPRANIQDPFSAQLFGKFHDSQAACKPEEFVTLFSAI